MREDHEEKVIFILIAIISACLITIIGLTILLFTGHKDGGKIGINIIAGICRVDIVDTQDVSLVDDVFTFVNPKGGDSVLFEPGATYYTEGFKVKNIGNLPIKYYMSVTNDENINMKKFNEAFEIWITTNPLDTADNKKLSAFEGALWAGDSSVTYYLVIKMKPSAGNEFQNVYYEGIGVTVNAVQYFDLPA